MCLCVCVCVCVCVYIYSEEVKVTSGAPQRSFLGPLLFLAYVNNIWRNVASKTRLFTDDCIICRKILNIKDAKNLHRNLDRLGDWAEGNENKSE